MFDISFKSNVDAVSKRLTNFAYRQLPFAEAQAVTQLAKLAAQVEKTAMPTVFDKPTPFTVNSVAVQAARKDNPGARVYIRDKAAEYLAPYEFGGVQFTGRKPGNLVPVGATTNQYGNLPRGVMRRYLNRPDAYLGTVKTARGDVYGLWQRPSKKPAKTRRAGKGKGITSNTSGRLKLIVAIHQPVETTKRLRFGERAEHVVRSNFNRVFGAALAKAIATAR